MDMISGGGGGQVINETAFAGGDRSFSRTAPSNSNHALGFSRRNMSWPKFMSRYGFDIALNVVVVGALILYAIS